MMPIIVLDANIAVKILHKESDSLQALDFIKYCAEKNAKLVVPEHFLYELVNVCQFLGVDVKTTLKLFDGLKSSLLTVVRPSNATWLLAERISKHGHKNSGFPAMYDSIYHALAIEAEGIFLTADKKHVVKAESFGKVVLLKNWEATLKA